MTGQAVISFPCVYAVWDGADADGLRAVAGDQFVSAADGVAVVKGAGGRPEEMTPGWVAFRRLGPDGTPSARAVVTDPEAWAEQCPQAA